MDFLDPSAIADTTLREQQSFLNALNEHTKQPVCLQTLRHLTNSLQSIDTIQELDRNMIEQIEKHLKGINEIKSICESKLILPEAQELVMQIRLHMLPLKKKLERHKLKFEEMVNIRHPDIRVRRKVILKLVAENIKHRLKFALPKSSDLNFWTAGIIFRFSKLFPLEHTTIDPDVVKCIEGRKWENLNRKKGGEGYRVQDYIRRL